MDYPKSVPSVGLVNGKFVDENPVTGQVGSLISSEWGNAVTDELLNVIRAGGDEPVEAEHDQLLTAIKAIVKDSIPPEKIRTTLAAYGITDAYTKSVTYTKAEIEALLKNMSALPVGAMVPFPMGTVPAGFLEVDGSVQSKTAYPDLFAYLGNGFSKGDEGADYFRLPDSRGEFLRGWDHGRGVDVVRSIGTSQIDQMQGFKLNWNQPTVVSGGNKLVVAIASATGSAPVSNPNHPVELFAADGVNGVPRVGTETRPRNLAVMWCIKAWNAPVNQGTIDISALATSVTNLAASVAALPLFGVSQTWQNVISSRVAGVTYTNTTGKPIMVSICNSANPYQVFSLLVNGAQVAYSNSGGGSYSQAGLITAVVPQGSTYSASVPVGTISNWVELR